MTLADPNNPNSTAGNAHMSGGSSIYEGQGSGKQDTFARDFIKHLGLMSLMSNPNTRPEFIKGRAALNFFRDPSRKTGAEALAPMLGFNPGTRDLVKYLPFLADPSARTAKGIAQKWAQNQGLGALFKKYGPKTAYALFNQGGNFGLGEGGRFGQGIGPGLENNPLQTIGKLKWAAANPAFAGIMALINKFSPRIEGQTGALGQGLGPQLANLFGRKSYAEAMEEFGPGIMGGTLGPRIRNFFGGGGDREEGTGIMGGTLGPRLKELFTRKKDPIQEIEVTAQKRPTQEQLLAQQELNQQLSSIRGAQAGMYGGGTPGIDYMVADASSDWSDFIDFEKQNMKWGDGVDNRVGETGGKPAEHLYGLTPGVAQSTNQGLRALNWARKIAKRKNPSKRDWYRPDRKIALGGGRK